MKLIKKTLIIISTVIILYFLVLSIQKHFIRKELNRYWQNPASKKVIYNYDVVRCNWSLIDPTVAFVSHHLLLDEFEELKIYFYQPKNYIFGDFERNTIGVTGVKNTTFPELLKMVKEDCKQFQESNEYEKETDMNWTYGKYKSEKEKKKRTKEELKQIQERRKKVQEQIKNGTFKPEKTIDEILEEIE